MNITLKSTVREAFPEMDARNSFFTFFKRRETLDGIGRTVWYAADFQSSEMEDTRSWQDYDLRLASEIVETDPDAILLNADRVEDFRRGWSPEALEWVIRRCYKQPGRESHLLSSYLEEAINWKLED